MAKASSLCYCSKVNPRDKPPLFVLLAVAFLVLGALSYGALKLDPAVQLRMKEAVEKKLRPLAAELGLEVSYASASPSIIHGVALRGVAAYRDGELLASARSIRLSYYLPGLLLGKTGPDLLRLEGLRLELDLDRDLDLLRRIARMQSRTDSAAEGHDASDPLEIELRDAVLELRGAGMPGMTANLRSADALIASDSSIRLSLRGALSLRSEDGTFPLSRLDIPLAGNGTIAPGGSGALASLSFSADSELGRVAPLRALASYDGKAVELALTAAAAGTGLERFKARYDLGEGRLSVDLAFNRFSPDAIVAGLPIPLDVKPWLAGRYTGSATLSTDLTLEGSTLSVDISGPVPLPVLGAGTRFSLSAAGSFAGIQVREAGIAGMGTRVFYSGAIYPASLGAQGRLTLRQALAPEGDLAIDLSVEGAGRSWFAYAEDIRLVDSGRITTLAKDLIVSLEAGARELSYYVDAAIVDRPGEYLPDDAESASVPKAVPIEIFGEYSLPRISVEGQLSLSDEPYIEAAVHIDPAYIARPLVAVLGDRADSFSAIANGVRLGADLNVYSDFSTLSYSTSNLVLTHDDLSPGFVSMSLVGNAERLELKNLEAAIGDYRVSGAATLSFGSQGALSFDLDTTVQDIPYSVRGDILDRVVHLEGSYGLIVIARPGPAGTALQATCQAFPLPLGTERFLLSLDLSGEYRSSLQWKAALAMLSIEHSAGLASVYPSLNASGFMNQDGAYLESFTVRDRLSALAGSATLAWTLEGEKELACSLILGAASEERYKLDLRLMEREFFLEAAIDKARLARFNLPLREGAVDGVVRAGGSYADPHADFSFTLNPGKRDPGLPFASGIGSYREGVLSIAQASLFFGEQRAEGIDGRYDTRTGSASLQAAFRAELGLAHAKGRISIDAVAERVPDGSQDNYTISGMIDEFFVSDAPVEPWPVSAALSTAGVDVRLGPADEIRFSLGAQGDIRASMAGSLPLSFTLRGTIAPGNIALEAKDVVVDMPFLFKALDESIINAASGTGRGELSIRGNPEDPDMEGSFFFSDLYLRLPEIIPEPIGPLEAPLYFTGRAMETDQVGVRCGQSVLNASLTATLRSYAPDELRINVTPSGGGLVPVNTRLLGMDIKGGAVPNLTITLNDQASIIGGTILLDEGDIVLTTELIAGGEAEEADYRLGVNLDISFGKGVRLYFPDRNLPVVYGLTDPSSRLVVRYSGSTGDFTLKGRAQLRGGSVFYIQRNFYLKSASIEFNENKDSFDPLMSLEAETRTRDGDTPILIKLRADDVRMSSLSFKLESVPSRTEGEIVKLLGRDLLALDEEGKPDIAQAFVEHSDLLPQFNVISLFERKAQDFLGLDIFFVRTQLVQRWLYELSGLSGAGAAPSLSDYLDNTAITAGKYLGDSLYLQMLLRLQQEGLAGDPLLRLDSELGMEWVTPHFLFNWSFKPENPDALFVTDHKFSFYWRIPLK